jgi:membrane-bound ClpP family serine protease
MIKARGELWKAKSIDENEIASGTEVEVVGSESMILWVRPLQVGSKNAVDKD